VRWHAEAGPNADSTYNPWAFRFIEDERWPFKCKEKLRRFIDPVTEQHCSFKLIENDGDSRRHAFVTQKEWGCWSSYRSAIDAVVIPNFPIPIAFEPRSQAVIVPLALDFPILLSRALALCSGLAPRILTATDYPAYANPSNGLVAGGAGYLGNCIAYKYVPSVIAKRFVIT
jgi:hypothetical protein